MNPFKTVLIAALAGAFLFAAAASVLPKRTKVSLAFTVAQQARQETSDYAYDGYYAIRAAELASDTLMSWLSTPSVVREIHAAAGLALSDAEALKGRAFRARKVASQNVVVSFAAPDADAARKLSEAAFAVLAPRVSTLARAADGESLFVLAASEPVVAGTSVAPKAAGAAGLLIGVFAGLLLAYATARKNPQP